MLKYLFKSPVFISIIIIVITLITFARVLTADFVMWDDDRMIYQNPYLKPLSLDHLGWIFSHADVTRRYTPLAALNYSITYQLCRLNPFGYHFSAWVFHGLNAAILFFILRILLIKGLSRRNTKVEPGWINFCAAVGALVWSLHPLRTEPVAWAGANFYSQATFFALLSLLCYLWAQEDGLSSRSHFRRLLASAAFFTAALLSHPIVIGFFAVFIVLDVYPLGKIRGKWWRSAQARKVLLEKIPFIAVALIITAFTVLIRLNDVSLGQIPLSQFGIFDRIMQAMYIWAYYIWRPLYPVNLMPYYSTLISFDPFSLPFIASAIGIISIGALLILLRRRYPLAITLAICYLILLVPVLGFFEHPHYPCDRYSLTASICLSVLIAAFLVNLKKPSIRYGMFFLSIIVIAGLGIMSFQQTRIWNNSVSLFRHMIRILGKDSYVHEMQWRLAYFIALHPEIKNRDVNEAVNLARNVCQFTNYQNPVAMDTLAAAYASAGRFSEAVDTAKTASNLADVSNQPELKKTIEFHLSFYEQGRPYIEMPLGTAEPNYSPNL